MLTPINVANYFISIGDYDDLSNLKIQKLVYYAYGWHLAIYDIPLFKEKIEAWDYGPVVPELYQQLKKYKDMPVPLQEDFNVDSIPKDKQKFLQDIYIAYASYSPGKLCMLTHIKSSPWDVVYKDDMPNNVINDYLLKVYFNELKSLSQVTKSHDQVHLARSLTKDNALTETMYVLSRTDEAEKIFKALEPRSINETVEIDWRNV